MLMFLHISCHLSSQRLPHRSSDEVELTPEIDTGDLNIGSIPIYR
jgi:hypothetical protein